MVVAILVIVPLAILYRKEKDVEFAEFTSLQPPVKGTKTKSRQLNSGSLVPPKEAQDNVVALRDTR